eukprot:TRINITY_DN3212_c0_g1_i1.p1 TRINITY_DN3212_c0_g1~~TRINITY_DN3212_c0_g1_i1.p1  ORF type:complete len:306 (+),score=47.12 TRINITY_DN3212_c0_g1_i1:233-1150(+)
MKFYAVRKGRVPGIYETWDECERQVTGFPRPAFKKFNTLEEALGYMNSPQPYEEQTATFTTPFQFKPLKPTIVEKDPAPAPPPQIKIPKPIKLEEEHKKPKVEPETIPKNTDYVVIYCDGSCLGNGTDVCYAGAGVYFSDKEPLKSLNLSGAVSGLQTNQRAELTAAFLAIKQVDEYFGKEKNLEIRTDSIYTIKCITEWMDNWKRNGWRNAKRQPVMNKDLIMLLDDKVRSRSGKIKWTHVRGHVGEFGNEKADQLAKEGSLKSKHEILSSTMIKRNVLENYFDLEEQENEEKPKKKRIVDSFF